MSLTFEVSTAVSLLIEYTNIILTKPVAKFIEKKTYLYSHQMKNEIRASLGSDPWTFALTSEDCMF